MHERAEPPSQRVTAAPGSEHGENPVPFQETKPENKTGEKYSFYDHHKLTPRETRSPPPWPKQSPPPSAAPGSHGTPGTASLARWKM